MKITIEIDGAPPARLTSGNGDHSESKGSGAPADVVAKAQAQGARDGGGAPAEPPATGAPPIPQAIAGSTAPASSAGGDEQSVSAGSAPGGEESYSTVVEQDPDAPTAVQEEDDG